MAAIFLVHGTFAGDDPLGFIRGVSLLFPDLAERALVAQKQVSDRLFQDAGNYTSEYARRLQQDSGISVHTFRWSSENHHLARADAAIHLIDRIAGLGFSPSSRVLLWGHSHGGNAFALMTNLLAADAATRRRFFRAGRSYYRGFSRHRVGVGAWHRVQELLRHNGAAQLPTMDLVTFGTPIRYGWDTDGYGHLLHFVHHRPRPDGPAYRTSLPGSVDDIAGAVDGDYIQQWGIAGTNLTPNIFSWRSWLADVRLGRLLQSGVRRGDLWHRLRAGVRVADEGLTLLVDYGPMKEPFPLNFAGHAVYTRLRWLPFHAREIARRFYGDPTPGG
ncbi:MAG: hypothetical protein JJ992_07440 [Planctomycetes bacterium]|nr:hypothetical protein [Planctomycetota bacterium]